ncbi:MAG: choice-of-anchor O protein [Desulfobulbaceae bacterium]|nr:choice-of-anchor O protein [Desulfobulbaceae bacterium]
MVAAEELLWPFELKLKSKVWVTVGTQTSDIVGDVKIWNTQSKLKIQVTPAAEFKIDKVHIHIVTDDLAEFSTILNKKGKPVPAKFDYITDYDDDVLADKHLEEINLGSELDLCWGIPENCPTVRYIVVHVQLKRLDEATGDWVSLTEEGAFAAGVPPVDANAINYAEYTKTFSSFQTGEAVGEAIDWGYYIAYQAAKVQPGHFIDAPVLGLTYKSPTQDGITNETGEFRYIPKEQVDFSVGSLSLGSALGDQRISPVDLFGVSELVDPKVINIARLLQSLDADGDPQNGAIQITEPVRGCLDSALGGATTVDFGIDADVEALIYATVAQCVDVVTLNPVSLEDAAANLNIGQKAGNIVKKNASKTPDMKSDKAKIEIMPVYVPALKADGTATEVVYYNEDGTVKETRDVAKPIVITYVDEVEGTGVSDVFVSISRDDGDTWKRSNISRTADKSSFTLLNGVAYPGDSAKPMLHIKDNKIFVAWTDKFCRGGRPGYAITTCDDPDTPEVETPETGCQLVCTGSEDEETSVCELDYPGDDAYWEDDIFGVGGPQRSVTYDPVDWPEMGEVPYSCVWAARGTIEPSTGEVKWFKPERLTSGRRDAHQLFAGAGTGVGFAIVWQEDPKGLMPGEGDGPGEGWSGANTNNKTDIMYSYITLSDFDKIDLTYVSHEHGDVLDDIVDTDLELAGRVKALVPMSLPVKISDNDVCNLENMAYPGVAGEHDFDEEGQGTHRYCGTMEGIGTAEAPGSNPLCSYTVVKINPVGEIHNICVTADGRLLDGNTGASRPNVFLQPYKKTDGTMSAYAIIGYEESKGVGTPPEDEEGCGDEEVVTEDETDEYKPDVGKNVIYHSFDLTTPEIAGGGGIINLPETDAAGNPVYLVDDTDEDGEPDAPLLDWKGDPQLAYENARRVRFITQPKSKAGASKTVLVALYRQGEEGSGKPADIFMRRIVAPSTGNPYAFGNFVPGAQNVSSVYAIPEYLWQDPFDSEAPVKMLRWSWTPANLADSSAKNPYTDSRAHRGSLNGDELIIGYSLTPNWGRLANDKYDFYIRRSFNGGQSWTTVPLTTDPSATDIEHNVVFRVPVVDSVNQTVTWDEEVVTTAYAPGASEQPRNVSNLRNNRISVMEPRLVKTPGTITNSDGITPTGYPEDIQDNSVYQIAYGVEFNQNSLPIDVVLPQMPLDIYYGRTNDKGQRFDTVIVTPGDGNGKPEEGWNPLAKDIPQQGAVQLKQTPDGSRMYSIWLEEGSRGSDIMFRRVDYPEVTQ